MDLINIILLISFIVILVTGIRTSHSLFWSSTKAPDYVLTLHIVFSLVVLVLVIIHALMHIKVIKLVFNKMKTVGKSATLVGISVIFFVAISSIVVDVIPRIVNPKDEFKIHDDNQNATKNDEEK